MESFFEKEKSYDERWAGGCGWSSESATASNSEKYNWKHRLFSGMESYIQQLPDNALYGGVPARKIKDIENDVE